jgi:hypothetical protein
VASKYVVYFHLKTIGLVWSTSEDSHLTSFNLDLNSVLTSAPIQCCGLSMLILCAVCVWVMTIETRERKPETERRRQFIGLCARLLVTYFSCLLGWRFFFKAWSMIKDLHMHTCMHTRTHRHMHAHYPHVHSLIWHTHSHTLSLTPLLSLASVRTVSPCRLFCAPILTSYCAKKLLSLHLPPVPVQGQ